MLPLIATRYHPSCSNIQNLPTFVVASALQQPGLAQVAQQMARAIRPGRAFGREAHRLLSAPRSGVEIVTMSLGLCVKPLPTPPRSLTGANMVPR